jgi:hypothetical protein
MVPIAASTHGLYASFSSYEAQAQSGFKVQVLMGALSVTTGVLTETTDEADYRRALQRIRAEFLEMPGMKLTPAQVERLAGVNGMVCARALNELVVNGLLCRRGTGTYTRS